MIRNKGLEKINLDDLVEELLPKGRALVPTKIKEDLLARIKTYLENDQDYKRLTGYWMKVVKLYIILCEIITLI